MIFRFAYLAAKRAQLRGYLNGAKQARAVQHATLLAKVRRNKSSDYGRDHAFDEFYSAEDFRRRHPITDYEHMRPYVDRVLAGDESAMFARGTKVLMFAMSSGTTGAPKHLPITAELFKEYRAGWQIWGAGVYGDHRDLVWKKTLQLSSDWQQSRTATGTPCGQISGLAAETRPLIARPIFLLPSCVNRIHTSSAKHYVTSRIALAARSVGMIITANPSTLIEFAKRADEHASSLIRDIHDGTLNSNLPVPVDVRQQLERRVRWKNPRRARQLERILHEHGSLLPRYVWPKLSVLAVWTGGSVSVYLPQVRQLYGEVAVRDHGLSASEGRMSIPLADGAAAGILDYRHHYFEFIPVAEYGHSNPVILEGHELREGQDYYILLTTSGGLYRYDIQDVVRCQGFIGQAPLIEFLNKGKHFSNVTGEKLSEYQAIRAVKTAFAEEQLQVATFTVAPVMDRFQKKPRYALLLEPEAHGGKAERLAQRVHANLEANNLEYREKCASGRLLPLIVQEVASGTWAAFRDKRTAERGNFEEFKHPCLVGDLNFREQLDDTLGKRRQFAAGA